MGHLIAGFGHCLSMMAEGAFVGFYEDDKVVVSDVVLPGDVHLLL